MAVLLQIPPYRKAVIMIGRDEFSRIVKVVLDAAEAPEVELMLSTSESALTRFANNTIHQNVFSADSSLTIRTVDNGRTGTASLNRFDDESLVAAVKLAEAVMKHAKADPDYVPMEAQEPYSFKQPRHYAATAAFGPFDRAAVVGKAFAKCEAEGCEAAGILSNDESAIGIANSKGLLVYEVFSSAEYSITVAANDVSGWSKAGGRDISTIDFDATTDEAIRIWKLAQNPVSLEPGHYDVVMPPSALADMVLFLSWAGFSPMGYHLGTSPFSGKIGTKIFGDNITIVDDHDHELALGMPFDFEGAPRTRVPLVEKGVMTGMVYDRKLAKKYGAKSTGHGLPQPNSYGAFPGNMVMEGGDSSLEKMIAGTKRGVLLTHLHYTNLIKPSDLTLTGMTRDGVFLIEDGKITKALKNMRYTDSVIRVLNNVMEISADRKQVEAFFGGSFGLPAVKVRDFHFTSSTEF